MSEHKRPWRDYYDSEYLTGDALPDEGRTFLIIGKSRDEVEGHDGAREHKLALEFSDGNRFLVNITNASYMAHMFGSPYPADWVGRRVTLAFDPTIMFGKERVGGIRVMGSPELTEPLTFMFQGNARKKPRPVTLMPTSGEHGCRTSRASGTRSAARGTGSRAWCCGGSTRRQLARRRCRHRLTRPVVSSPSRTRN